MKNVFLSILAYVGSTILVLVGMVVAALLVVTALGLVALGIALLALLIAFFLLLVGALAPFVSLPVLFRRQKIQQFVREATAKE